MTTTGTACGAMVTEYGDWCVLEPGHAGHHRIDFARAKGREALGTMLADEHIEQLRTEAGAAGDLAQVAICDRALAGDAEAIDECQRVIDEARAIAAKEAK
jgi:hypothetical protein